MPRRIGRLRSIAAAAAVVVVAVLTAPLPAGAGSAAGPPRPAAGPVGIPADQGRGSLDTRVGGAAVSGGRAVLRAQRALAAALGPEGIVDIDERTGTPRTVARLDGFLTGPSAAPPADVALGYVRSHLAAFGLTEGDLAGLRLVRDYEDVLGTHHLVWQQHHRGVPVWDQDLRAHVTADGRLVAVGGSPLPSTRVPSVAPDVPAARAVAAAYRDAGAVPPILEGRTRRPGAGRWTSFRTGDEARLVLFGTGRGPRLAWRTITAVSTQEVNLSIVDAATGTVRWRANLVKSDQAGTGQATDYYPSTTVPSGGGVPHTVSFPVADGTSLRGNNAWTFPDVDDDNAPDREIPATAGVDWNYPPALDTTNAFDACSEAFPCTWRADVAFSWQPHVEANAVQVFHFLNAFHDHLLAPPIAFTEAAGNFQAANTSGEGAGGDPVVANVMDGAAIRGGLPDPIHSYNANMLTLPDGTPPLMQMYLFPSIPFAGIASTNGGDDASVVYHEYTHGLSNRLVTLADGSGALNSAQAAAMGEAWSDFYAMDFLVSQGHETDTGNADVILGRYVSGAVQVGFIRTEAIDCRVGAASELCPGGAETDPGGYTFGDFGHVFGTPEVHADGEIWAQTLWDLRRNLGSTDTLMLVTRAMELSPPEPSFLDMRNAILQADLVAFGGAHRDLLWELFAERGMGFFAVAIDGSDVAPIEDFSLPPVCPDECGRIRGTVVDAATGKPVRRLTVAVAGHASGFLGDLADRTDRRGAFTIPDVPFHDYVLTVRSPAHEALARPVEVDGAEVVRLSVVRDWASLGGGARLVRFTGPDYAPLCGPDFAWDTSLSTGWGSDHPDFDGSGSTGPRTNMVKLPRAIDVTRFGFATAGTCGDGPRAAVRVFEIQTRSPRGRWETAFRGNSLERGAFHVLRPIRGTGDDVRFVRLVMLDNYGDPLFMDVLELTVRGVPA
jgi:hypothetical protein